MTTRETACGITIRTRDEAEQQRTVRLPLGCDQQGRHPEVAEDDSDDALPTDLLDELSFWGQWLIAFVVLCGVIGFVYQVIHH